MNDEKRIPNPTPLANRETEDRTRSQAASRARNRTVMLTPEMTGQVRALLYQNQQEEDVSAPVVGRRDAVNELLPPMDWSRPEHAATSSREEEVEEAEPLVHEPMRAHLSRPERSGTTDRIAREAVLESAEPPRPAGQPTGFSVNPAASSRRVGSASMVRRALGGVPHVPPVVNAKVVGFLVSYDKSEFGEVHMIRSGRWLLTSRPTDHGEYILIEDDTVSPLHAIVRATKEGKIQVLDQLSEYGTGVTKAGATEEQEVAGTMVTVEHGDILRLGERRFVLCTVPQGIAEE